MVIPNASEPLFYFYFIFKFNISGFKPVLGHDSMNCPWQAPRALAHIEICALALPLKRFMPKHSSAFSSIQPEIGWGVRETEKKHSQMLVFAQLYLQIISTWCCSGWLEMWIEQERETMLTRWKAAAWKTLHKLGSRALKFLMLLRSLGCVSEKPWNKAILMYSALTFGFPCGQKDCSPEEKK